MQFIKLMTFAFALATSSIVVMTPAPVQADLAPPTASQRLLGAWFSRSARPGPAGAEISLLAIGSPLLRARLVGGGTYMAEERDVITSVNDQPVQNDLELDSRLRDMSSGQEVKLGIVDVRTRKTVYVWVKLR